MSKLADHARPVTRVERRTMATVRVLDMLRRALAYRDTHASGELRVYLAACQSRLAELDAIPDGHAAPPRPKPVPPTTQHRRVTCPCGDTFKAKRLADGTYHTHCTRCQMYRRAHLQPITTVTRIP